MVRPVWASSPADDLDSRAPSTVADGAVLDEDPELATTVVAPSTDAGGSPEVAGTAVGAVVVAVDGTEVGVVTSELVGATDDEVFDVSPEPEVQESSGNTSLSRTEGHSLPPQPGSTTWVLWAVVAVAVV